MKNFEKIAQLSDRCFSTVTEIERKFIEGKLSSTTKAKSISQAFFQFLNGKTEQESFDLLSMILEGKKTVTELNYVPSGKVFRTLFSYNFVQLLLHENQQRKTMIKCELW